MIKIWWVTTICTDQHWLGTILWTSDTLEYYFDKWINVLCILSEPNELQPRGGKSEEHSSPDRSTWFRGSPGETPPCTLMASNACKICLRGSVFQILIQIIPLVVPKLGSQALCERSKLWWHVSGPFLGMSPRPSARAQCVALFWS